MTVDNAHPLVDSPFCFSSFHDVDFISGVSEYPSAPEAERRYKFEDGQVAFDTGLPVKKYIFGIYASIGEKPVSTYKEFVSAAALNDRDDDLVFIADKWDSSRNDLVGSATIVDWAWGRVQDEDFTFDENGVLHCLREEVEKLTEWFAKKQRRESFEDLRVDELLDGIELSPGEVECLDLYYIWRTLFSLKQEISSAAEVYESLERVSYCLAQIIDTLGDKIMADTADSPEEAIIAYIKT